LEVVATETDDCCGALGEDAAEADVIEFGELREDVTGVDVIEFGELGEDVTEVDVIEFGGLLVKLKLSILAEMYDSKGKRRNRKVRRSKPRLISDSYSHQGEQNSQGEGEVEVKGTYVREGKISKPHALLFDAIISDGIGARFLLTWEQADSMLW
jgi:hypothetical protein